MSVKVETLAASHSKVLKREAGWPAIIFVIIVALAATYAFSPRPSPSFPATEVHPRDLLIAGLAQQNGRFLAAGEQGHILLADSAQGPWREARVAPQRIATLTQVGFIGDKVALAVGHDARILRSEDAGASWKEVFYVESPKDGPMPADGAMAPPADAGFSGPPPDDSASEDANAPSPLQPDPLLGFSGPYNGHLFAYGAFGLMLVSSDDGRSWTRQTSPVFGDRHINGMTRLGDGSLLAVGERGLLAQSSDDGASWKELPSIYTGSFFGALLLPSRTVVVYGMRGHAFYSRDNGKSWQASTVPVGSSLFGGAVDAAGQPVLVGASSTVLVSRDDGGSFELRSSGGRNDFAAVLPLDATHWLTGSDGGLQTITAQGRTPETAADHPSPTP